MYVTLFECYHILWDQPDGLDVVTAFSRVMDGDHASIPVDILFFDFHQFFGAQVHIGCQ